jgi:3',5'-cyclic AMP phosphodiesterase CpdA
MLNGLKSIQAGKSIWIGSGFGIGEQHLKIIHLSDTHIGKSNNLEKVSQIVDWIIENRDLHEADVVVISGDIVDDGQEWQFKQASVLISRLREAGLQVLGVPGNHDYGPDGIREDPGSQRDFRELISGIARYPAVVYHGGTAFILLDSMLEEMKRREIWGAQGYLGERQIQDLDRLLDELSENPAVEKVVLVLHHHPFDYLFYHGLRDHLDLKSVIARRKDQPPRVNALLFGHKHLDHRFNDSEDNKEELYGIDLIYASGQSVERDAQGNMTLPVIDLTDNSIQRFKIP